MLAGDDGFMLTGDDGVCLRIGREAMRDEMVVDIDSPTPDAAAADDYDEQGDLGNSTKLPADGDEQGSMKLPAGPVITLATPGGDGSAEGRHPKPADRGCNTMLPADGIHLIPAAHDMSENGWEDHEEYSRSQCTLLAASLAPDLS
jgi:hypothetical protein